MTAEKQRLDVVRMKKIKAILCLLTLFGGCGTDKADNESSATRSTSNDEISNSNDTYLGIRLEFEDNATLSKILARSVDINKLQFREERGVNIYYFGISPTSKLPYTGFAKLIRNKKLQELWEIKDGKKNGLFMSWHKTGQKKIQGRYLQGKWDDLWTTWYLNGIKKYEQVYKSGKLISAKANTPNGQACPLTNLSNGTGIRIFYNEDGNETKRLHYKKSAVVKI